MQQKHGTIVGGISALYIAHSALAVGALSGGVLDLSAFGQVELAMEDALFSEDEAPDGDGTSYTASIAFRKFGDDRECAAFEAQYSGGQLDALCVSNEGLMYLFRFLSFSRRLESGARAADFSGRAYSLSAVSWQPASFVDTLL
jgi:hypothetical protein